MGKDEEAQISIEMVSSSSECDPSKSHTGSVQTATPEAGTQTEEAGSPQSCPDSASLLNSCLAVIPFWDKYAFLCISLNDFLADICMLN